MIFTNYHFFQLRIEAYDLGLPTPLSSDLDLTIYVQNVDNYRPRFPNKHIYINFTENADNNNIFLPTVIERDEIDVGDEPVLPVCYYLVDGNGDNTFELQKSTHKYGIFFIETIFNLLLKFINK